MDTLEERKYRFTEIVTAVHLLTDTEVEDYTPTLPNGTLGLSDIHLKSALMSQAFREGEKFSNKLSNALLGSAMSNIIGEEHESHKKPTPDDVSALGVAMSLVWAHFELPYFLYLSGILHEIYNANGKDKDLIPSEVATILQPSNKVKNFSKFEPYELLREDFDPIATEQTNAVEGENGEIPTLEDLQSIINAVQEEMKRIKKEGE